MSKFAVETEKLKSSANIVEEKVARFDAEWEKLYAEVQALKGLEWEGVASQTFNSKLDGYKGTFQEMSTVVKRYIEFLRTTATGYEKKEQEITDAARNLNAGN